MRRSQVIMVGAIVVLGAGSSTLAWRWHQRGPDRASVSGAVDRFRTSSTVATPAAPLVPPPGVYVYRGSGSEKLSFLGTHQSQGPALPATVVTRANGCWQFRIDYNSFHNQTWDRCSTGTAITETGGTASQHFDFMAFGSSEHSTTTCTPPMVVAKLDASPGTTAPLHCTGRSQTTNSTFAQDGTATYLGRESITVGTDRVEAVHTREAMHLTGGQIGDVTVDIWFATTNGLPLKETHSIKVDSPAPKPINQVTYTEVGNWELTSLAPQT